MKRHIKFDVIRVHYVPGEGEIDLTVIGGLVGTAEFDEENLGLEVGHTLFKALEHYSKQEDSRFYLAENGEVYPQFRMEER